MSDPSQFYYAKFDPKQRPFVYIVGPVPPAAGFNGGGHRALSLSDRDANSTDDLEALALAGVLDTEPVVFDGAPPQRTPHPRAHYHRWRLGSDEYVYHAHPEERDFPGHKHFHLDGHAMYYVPLAAADPPPEPTSEPPASEPDDDEWFVPGPGGGYLGDPRDRR